MALIYRTQQVTEVYANSGYWEDIQNAVDQAALAGGGNVYIPEGVFNFVNVGESWTGVRVVIPPRVNVFGAPTERDANDQVIEWKTVLVMPWEVPTAGLVSSPTWFSAVNLPQGPTQDGFRFSDIKLVGWRYFDYLQNGEPNWTIPYDPNNPGDRGSITMYTGLSILMYPYESAYGTWGLINFRVDHCCFQDMGGSAISLTEGYCQYNRHVISGVIDHCRLVNSYGDPGRLGTSGYKYRTIDYGIAMRRWASDVWENDFRNVIGKYNDYTIFIENNYFSKWRHSTSTNDGLHQVVRYNVWENSYAVGEIDSHGSSADVGREYAVGTRAAEIYGNTFRNPITIWDSEHRAWAINIRGGCAIITNNTLIGHTGLVAFNNEYGNDVYQPKCSINNTYIWNNNLGGATIVWYIWHAQENVNYFLRAPNMAQDGFDYTPYPYPHPLTAEFPHLLTVNSNPSGVPFTVRRL